MEFTSKAKITPTHTNKESYNRKMEFVWCSLLYNVELGLTALLGVNNYTVALTFWKPAGNVPSFSVQAACHICLKPAGWTPDDTRSCLEEWMRILRWSRPPPPRNVNFSYIYSFFLHYSSRTFLVVFHYCAFTFLKIFPKQYKYFSGTCLVLPLYFPCTFLVRLLA